MSILHGLLGVALILGYVFIEARGMVFSGTDTRPPPPGARVGSGGTGGGGGGGGIFFWGSGYRGGK